MSAEFGCMEVSHTAVPRKNKHQMTLILICIFNIHIDIFKALYRTYWKPREKGLDRQLNDLHWEHTVWSTE